MGNEIALLLAAILVIFCLGVGYWFLVRPVRQLQVTTREMQTIFTATQAALAQTQQETIALRRALTATTIQGQWGEMQLQRIVELAGMSPYCDFDTQATLPGANGGQRPDLLVRLSNGRSIAVDAKAPINSYIQVYASSDDTVRAAHLQQYAKRVRDHVMRLASKGYWKHFEQSPEWVVLFIPNEGMFRAALEHDPTLLDKAMQQHVLLASPVTLLALLKGMAHGWQQEKRARSVEEIIEYSHTLQRQLLEFVTQWQKLRKELSDTTTAFNLCTTTYQRTIFPVIQQICSLDGTINGEPYDLSRTSSLRTPNLLEDLAVLAEEEVEMHVGKDDGNNEEC